MGYTTSQAKEFINRIAPLMVNEGKKRGYMVVSAAIAQAVIEGAAGTSLLAKNYHNHFGLKCGQAWLKAGKPSVNMRTKEEYSGKLVSINDYFRVYADDQEGVKGYYDFINTSRYANLKTASDYVEYAKLLKADGYATSSTYVNTLCSTVQKYDLQKYDSVKVQPERYIVGQTYTLKCDLNIRDNPDGSQLKYDNITENAKRNSVYDNYGHAILKKGTRVTCQEVVKLESSTWIRIPSGWVCGISKDRIYIK